MSTPLPPINTLQPGVNRRLNITPHTPQFREIVAVPLDGSVCTKDTLLTDNRIIPLAKDYVVPNPVRSELAITDERNSERQGPMVLPFIRHLLGVRRGAFSGDVTILPAVHTSEVLPFELCVVTGLDSDLGVPKVAKSDITKATEPIDPVWGVSRGVTEDLAKRTYRGIGNPEYTQMLSVVQFCGTCDARIDEAVEPTLHATLYATRLSGGTIRLSTTVSPYRVGRYEGLWRSFQGSFYIGRVLLDGPQAEITPKMSFWPRMVLHPAVPADPEDPESVAVPAKWYLHVRRGWRWAVRDAPEELAPDDLPDGTEVAEWEFEAENGKSAFLSFDFSGSDWDQEDQPDYDTLPTSGQAGKRYFVFATTEAQPNGTFKLIIREPGDAVAYIPSNDSPTSVEMEQAGSPGTSLELSRSDHKHAGPTGVDVQVVEDVTLDEYGLHIWKKTIKAIADGEAADDPIAVTDCATTAA